MLCIYPLPSCHCFFFSHGFFFSFSLTLIDALDTLLVSIDNDFIFHSFSLIFYAYP